MSLQKIHRPFLMKWFHMFAYSFGLHSQSLLIFVQLLVFKDVGYPGIKLCLHALWRLKIIQLGAMICPLYGDHSSVSQRVCFIHSLSPPFLIKIPPYMKASAAAVKSIIGEVFSDISFEEFEMVSRTMSTQSHSVSNFLFSFSHHPRPPKFLL